MGEWLALAHGTRYVVTAADPFIVFDLMRGHERAPLRDLKIRVAGYFMLPNTWHDFGKAIHPAAAYAKFQCDGASSGRVIDRVEGLVYRVERKGEVDFLAKWVRPDKVDGCYLPEVSGEDPIWHWRPT